ncbi:MAG: hypothetical protein SFW36_16635 [Leptolyngbyaceae cyanobacterium bins.59]|nr:hypothetical protein [Leptolyngbyaceae cyanobacterium bins.59]
MKRPFQPLKPETATRWIPFITKVLAFIGLWQVLSNSMALLDRWF